MMIIVMLLITIIMIMIIVIMVQYCYVVFESLLLFVHNFYLLRFLVSTAWYRHQFGTRLLPLHCGTCKHRHLS